MKIEPGTAIRVTRFIILSDTAIPAQHNFDLAAIRQSHEQDWAHLWQGRIEVSQPAVQQLVNACVYHLYSQSRAGMSLAMGPCGISGDGYLGRVFWDADLWVFPALALLQPDLAKG
ncbi:hypothetical protein RZS08_32160, partial [Arthrospira platensis SPKY1]|nr:hypothetical protein [Arthrospira platensis SPKY1]